MVASGGRDGCVRVWRSNSSEAAERPEIDAGMSVLSDPQERGYSCCGTLSMPGVSYSPSHCGASAEVLTIEALQSQSLVTGCADGNAHVVDVVRF